jgi:hypothetical protein
MSLKNIYCLICLTERGILTCIINPQPMKQRHVSYNLKAFSQFQRTQARTIFEGLTMVNKYNGKLALFNAKKLAHADSPRIWRPSGRSAESKCPQSVNNFRPMTVTLGGIAICDNHTLCLCGRTLVGCI